MTARGGTRIVLLGFVAACAVIMWADFRRFHVAPAPASFVGAGMVYGGLGVMAEFAPELAGVFAVGWTLGLLYMATAAPSAAGVAKGAIAGGIAGGYAAGAKYKPAPSQIDVQRRVRQQQGGVI